jgi:hypothetical protein
VVVPGVVLDAPDEVVDTTGASHAIKMGPWQFATL